MHTHTHTQIHTYIHIYSYKNHQACITSPNGQQYGKIFIHNQQIQARNLGPC